MKHISLPFILMLFALSCVNAQQINDGCFQSYLRQFYPLAIKKNNKLVKEEAAKIKALYIGSQECVHDFEGIEWFTNLDTLTTSPMVDNVKLNFRKLPPTLKYLMVYQLDGDSLPVLPPSLAVLYTVRKIKNLPPLPPTLKMLVCRNSDLTVLPPLPAGLQYLDCSDNSLTYLPPLPSSLTTLICGSNKLTNLQSLPNNLDTLNVEFLDLTELPVLPASLKHLFISFDTKIACIKKTSDELLIEMKQDVDFYDYKNKYKDATLPQCLDTKQTTAANIHIADNNFAIALHENYPKYIDSANNLTQHATYATELKVTDAGIKNMEGIQGFLSLEKLDVANNNFTILSVFPAKLRELNCSSSGITQISNLPKSLIELICSDNKLKTLPAIPEVFYDLICNNNKLTELPSLPEGLYALNCRNNLLTNLPILPEGLHVENPLKLTPTRQMKLTPFGHFKLTP